jgi:hypothetical protein
MEIRMVLISLTQSSLSFVFVASNKSDFVPFFRLSSTTRENVVVLGMALSKPINFV